MIVTVCAVGCAYASLARAVERAPSGSTIVVRGTQHGDVFVERRLTIRGEQGAVIEGGTSGITVRAANARVEGLTLRGYALSDIAGNTGALVLEHAANAYLANNVIENCTADSIRVWYSQDATLENNVVRAGRDVFVTYSPGATLRGNTISGSRYGLHDMFSDGMTVTGNTFSDNEIGANFMYARRLAITHNTFSDNRGATGYGIGLEDVDASRITSNRFIGNHVGMNLVDSPTDPALPDAISNNLFSHNGSALSVQSNPHALRVISNGFVDNIEDVEVSGGGTAGGVIWDAGTRGNYWSQYAGYDRNRDGVGDIPYAPRFAFDSLTDAHPELQMFRYSPAAVALEFAARALPATASNPKLTDTAPGMTLPAQLSVPPNAPANPLAAVLALLSVVPIAAGRGLARARHRTASRDRQASMDAGVEAVKANAVRKLYAANRGVSNIDLCVHAGESVALWGPNGAGKTTFFRCILGERLDGGAVHVFGRPPSPFERETRMHIGYAPQHLPDFDSRVSELANLIAAIRGADRAAAAAALRELRLQEYADRFVNELSGGMRQRLAIALALIGDPPLLLLDEPTAGLDRESREIVIRLLQAQRAGGKTLVITSHLLEDVQALSDRVVILDEGRVTAESTTSEFVAQYLRRIS